VYSPILALYSSNNLDAFKFIGEILVSGNELDVLPGLD
jgi:hypothetical protein